MPVYIGSTPLSNAVTNAAIKNIYVGSEMIWPSKLVFSDGFDYSDRLLPSTWIQNGNDPYYIYAVNGNAQIFNNGTDGNTSCRALWNESSLTGVQYAKGVIVNIGNNARQTWLMIQADSGFNSYVGLQWNGSSLTLFTNINGTSTSRATSSKSQVVGDTLELRSSYNSTTGIYSYTGYVNGTSYMNWTDTSNLSPKGANFRRQGFGMNRNRSFFVSTRSTELAYWEGGDY